MEEQLAEVIESLSELCDINFRNARETHLQSLTKALRSGRGLVKFVEQITPEPHAGLLNLRRQSAVYALSRTRPPDFERLAKNLRVAFRTFTILARRLHAEISRRLIVLRNLAERNSAAIMREDTDRELRQWQTDHGVDVADVSDNVEGALDKILLTLKAGSVEEFQACLKLHDPAIPERYCVPRSVDDDDGAHMGFASEAELVWHFMKHGHEESAGQWSSPAAYVKQANLFLRKYSVPRPEQHFCPACLRAIKDDPETTALLIRREGGTTHFERKAGFEHCQGWEENVESALEEVEGDVTWEYKGNRIVSGIDCEVNAEKLRVIYATMDNGSVFLLSFFKPD